MHHCKLIKVLTRYKIGHFGDVIPNQSLDVLLKKLNLAQRKQTTHQEQTGWAKTENKILKLNKHTKPKPKTNTQL